MAVAVLGVSFSGPLTALVAVSFLAIASPPRPRW